MKDARKIENVGEEEGSLLQQHSTVNSAKKLSSGTAQTHARTITHNESAPLSQLRHLFSSRTRMRVGVWVAFFFVSAPVLLRLCQLLSQCHQQLAFLLQELDKLLLFLGAARIQQALARSLDLLRQLRHSGVHVSFALGA